MIAAVCGHLLLQRYEQFVKTLDAEPEDEFIVGSYLTGKVHNNKSYLPVMKIFT